MRVGSRRARTVRRVYNRALFCLPAESSAGPEDDSPMARVFNFSAGPAALPESVLARARDELLDWHGHGLSIMEMSHRSPEFEGVAAKAQRDLRALLGVPDDYAVLFLQGGATAQFAMVPINLLPEGGSADYIHTGQWAS